jgi:hypothetical protein
MHAPTSKKWRGTNPILRNWRKQRRSISYLSLESLITALKLLEGFVFFDAKLAAGILLDYAIGDEFTERSISPMGIFFEDLSPDCAAGDLFARKPCFGTGLEEVHD